MGGSRGSVESQRGGGVVVVVVVVHMSMFVHSRVNVVKE